MMASGRATRARARHVQPRARSDIARPLIARPLTTRPVAALLVTGALAAAAVLLAFVTATFNATATSDSNTFVAATIEDQIPVSAAATRTTATTCQVTWTPVASPRLGLTYDVTDGATTTLATNVAGTAASITVPAAALTPTVKARLGNWVSTTARPTASACNGFPSAPSAIILTPADTTTAVSWTAPTANGGTLASYQVSAVPSDGSLPTRTCSAVHPASTCTLTALTNGATYTITVTATSDIGTGPASSDVTAIPYPAGVMTSAAVKLWLDGADSASMYAGSTCSGGAATTTVGCWDDKSTSNNDAIQSTSANRPTLTTVNGRSVPGWDGSNDFLTLTPSLLPNGTTASTTLLAAKLTDPTPSTSGYRLALTWGSAALGQSRVFFKPTSSSNAAVDAYAGGLATPGTWSGAVDILTGQHASAAVTAWLNSGTAAGPTAQSFTTGTTAARVGNNPGGTETWLGPIPEVIVVSGALSSTDRRRVEEYLARKWATTVTASAPGTPTATGGNAQASVSWTAPAWNGGASVTGYTVTSSPGGLTCTTASTSCTVTGLTNGTAYTFTVTATNSVGVGATSAASNSVTPVTVPGAPTGVAATAADTTSSVSWTAPASNGGSAITSYTATAVPSDGGLPTRTCTAASSPCSLTGMTNGVTYTVSVTATSAVGTGSASTSTTVIPYPSGVMTSGALELWLDGADSSSTYAGSTCSGGAATTTVGCWNDKSTSNNDASQGTAANRPTLTTVNGRSVPGWDGSNDALSMTASLLPNGTSASTAFVAAKLTDPTPTTSGYRIALTWGSSALGQSRVFFKQTTSNNAAVDTWGNGLATAGTWSGAVDILTGQHASAAVTAWLDAGTAAGPTAQSFTTGTTNARVGNDPNGTESWYGPIPEVIVLSGTLTSTERRQIEEYLGRKWGGPITPAAPGTPTATTGTAQASVSWTVPAWDGGASVSSYTVTSSPGGLTCTTASTSCTVTGLTNGTAYTFRVTATNNVGVGPASAASNSVTPVGPPGAPTGVAAAAGDTTSSVSWTAPASNGGSAITSYTATGVPSDGSLPTRTCTAASSPCSLTGLTNGITYTVSVTATNALGTGSASSSTTVIPYPSGVMTSSATKVWLDARDSSTLSAASDCSGSNASTGTGVGCWKTRATNGWNAIAGSTKAVLTASAINGYQAIRFTRTNPDRYAITNTGIGALGSADRSMFAVAIGRTSADNSTNNTGVLAMWPGYHGGIHFTGYPNLNLAASYGYRSDAALGVGGSQSFSGATVLSAVALTSGSTLSLDAAVNARTPTGNSISGTTWYSHANNLRIGAMTDTIGSYTYPLDGDLGELVVLNASTTTSQRRQVEEYLARKWGTTITPAAPTLSTVTKPSSGQLTATWSAPSWNGGASVTSYTATATASGYTTRTCTTGSTSCTVTGLTAGVTYSVTVAATNSVGAGPSSNALNGTA